MTIATRWVKKSVAEKLALAGGVASLALCSGAIAEGAIIASPNAPIAPFPYEGFHFLDVDGDGTNDFVLMNGGNFAMLTESNGGRFVSPNEAHSDGFAKLSFGFVVGPTMSGYKFFEKPQRYITVTDLSMTGSDLLANGWHSGDTGFFGFKFTSGANTYYGWGELMISCKNYTNMGHGYKLTQLYYDNTGAPIRVGAIPEPSTCALALLAAGGVAAYRARRRFTRSE